MHKIDFFYPSSNEIDDIHAVMWKPEHDIRAIVQISHGMIEHIERYEEFASYLVGQGFLVVGNDHMGHGKSIISQQEWGYFSSQDASAKVVQDLYLLTRKIKKKYPHLPYFLLGHSMGSFMVRRYLMTHGKLLDGAIIVGTGNMPPSAIKGGQLLVKFLTLALGERHRSRLMNNAIFGLYNLRFKPGRVTSDWLSRNQENIARHDQDEACSFLFTLNGYKTLFSTLEYIEKPSNIEKIPHTLPLLFISGEEDPVGNFGKDVRKVYTIYRKSGIEDISIRLFPHDRHEVLNETDRAVVYEEIHKWLSLHLKTAGHETAINM